MYGLTYSKRSELLSATLDRLDHTYTKTLPRVASYVPTDFSGADEQIDADEMLIPLKSEALEYFGNTGYAHPRFWKRGSGLEPVSIFVPVVEDSGEHVGSCLFVSRLLASPNRHKFELVSRLYTNSRQGKKFSSWWSGETWCTQGVHPEALTMASKTAHSAVIPCIRWRVQLHRPGLPFPFMLVTDAEGARAILQDRNTSPGTDRRAALLHWVEEHTRRANRDDAATWTWVKAHMRGRVSCQWRGWNVTILPSVRDSERAGWIPKVAA